MTAPTIVAVASLLLFGCSHSSFKASPELISAAKAVGFHPSLEANVGRVEGLPANAVPTGNDSYLLPLGSQAPNFRLKTPVGKAVDLSRLRSKAVLLEFFATWCPHCQAETPHLMQIAKKLPASKYAVISVNGDGETAASLYSYDTYFHVPYPTLLDPSNRPGSFHSRGAPGKVTLAYRVHRFPTFYVIAPGGRIAWRADKELPDALLLRVLRDAYTTS